MTDDSKSNREIVSPWSNDSIAPMQAAGAIVPVVASENGPVLGVEAHGTAFFITEDGFFLTAAHVVNTLSPVAPAIVVFIFGGPGYVMMPVQFVAVHPMIDVAIGRVLVSDECRPSPMTLSTRRLCEGEPVAVLGYPRSTAHHTINSEGRMMSSLSCTPDYFEGRVLGHHPTGISLARTAAYTTDIVPPSPEIKDLGGASGGPLVSSSSLHVHGLLCSAAESYSICTDIEQILDWSIFEIQKEGFLTIRAMGQRFPNQIRVV